MNNALKALLATMLNRRYIGGKHIPEDRLVKSKTKWLGKKAVDEFEDEYRRAINDGLILRQQKRTHRGFGLHISLNPRKLKEIHRAVE